MDDELDRLKNTSEGFEHKYLKAAQEFNRARTTLEGMQALYTAARIAYLEAADRASRGPE